MEDLSGSKSPKGEPPRVDARMSALSEVLHLFDHDIRWAMSDVIGGLRLIEADRLDPVNRMQLDRVLAASDALAAMVDTALMAAAGETRIEDAAEATVLDTWLQAVRNRWSGRAGEMGIPFDFTVPEGPMPRMLALPPMQLDRLMGNLISNALRHGGESGVSVTVRLDRAAGMTLQVRDGGPGYPEAVLSRHRRGARPVARPASPAGGHGLGLHIAAGLAAQLDIALRLTNAEAGGAMAEVTVPPGALDWEGDAAASTALPDLTGLNVLVAEDNLTNQTLLRQLLGRMGARAVIAGDGLAALEALEAEPFDIALIDIEMPQMNGLDVMRAIRARGDAVAEMTLVALTAYVLRDNREAIYAAGCDGIIGKPIASAAEFGRALLRLMGQGREAEGDLAARADDDALGPKMDHDRLEALLAQAGPKGAQELLARLIDDLLAVRGVLDAAVVAGDADAVREQTHILIALAGAVGADRLWRFAEVLNVAAKRQRHADLPGLYEACRPDLNDLIALARARRHSGG